MPELSVNCAVCRTNNVGATPRGAYNYTGHEVCVFATCNRCRAGLVIYGRFVESTARFAGQDLLRTYGDSILDQLQVEAVFPSRAAPREIADLPESVASAFREGESNRGDARWLSAAGNYRTALDRALKDFRPDLTGTLYKKIEALADENALPPTLIRLMHEVRFLGNNIHELDDPDVADVRAGAEFTALLLTYLYELPARIERAEATRAKRLGKS